MLVKCVDHKTVSVPVVCGYRTTVTRELQKSDRGSGPVEIYEAHVRRVPLGAHARDPRPYRFSHVLICTTYFTRSTPIFCESQYALRLMRLFFFSNVGETIREEGTLNLQRFSTRKRNRLCRNTIAWSHRHPNGRKHCTPYHDATSRREGKCQRGVRESRSFLRSRTGTSYSYESCT